MGDVFGLATNDLLWVISALVVWLLSYVWLERLGADCLSTVLETIIAWIPPLSVLAVGLATIDQAQSDDLWPLFWVLFAATLVLLAWVLMTGKVTALIGKGSFQQTYSLFFLALVAVGAGIGGAWAGYQMAFGTVIVGWVLAGVAVALGLFAYSKQVFEKLA